MDSEAQEQPVADKPIEVPWGRDLLFWATPRMFISQILSSAPLKPYEGVRVIHGHPIRQAEIMGVVLSTYFHPDSLKLRFQVDDGTGLIMCYHFVSAQSSIDWQPGALVQVKGRFYLGKDSNGADVLGITAFSIRHITDPNEEMLYWAEVMHQNRFIRAEPKVALS